MSSQWTNKYAIMRDLSLAQGCVPVDIHSVISAQDVPPSLGLVEETEEHFFQNCVGDGEFEAPDLGLIKSMLDMVRDKEDISDTEESEKVIQISKLNRQVPEFVPSLSLENGVKKKNRKIKNHKIGDSKAILITKAVKNEPKVTITATKLVNSEPKLVTYEPTVFKPELATSEPKLVTAQPTIAKTVKPITKKKPRNIAMASFLESIGVDQSPKLLPDKKRVLEKPTLKQSIIKHLDLPVPTKPKPVLIKEAQTFDKVNHWLETAEEPTNSKPKKCYEKSEPPGMLQRKNLPATPSLVKPEPKPLQAFDKGPETAEEPTNSTPKKSTKKPFCLLDPSNMFKRKNLPATQIPVKPEPKPEPTSKVQMYKPSKWADQYYKTYTERANMQVILNEDVWARTERHMKEIDARRELELLKFREEAQRAIVESSETSSGITDVKCTDERGTKDQHTYELCTEVQSTDDKCTNEQGTYDQHTDELCTEVQGTDVKCTDERGTNDQHTDELCTEVQSTDDKCTNEQGTYDQHSEELCTEVQSTDVKCTDDQHTDELCTEVQSTDVKCTNELCTDNQCTDVQFSYEQFTDDQCTDDGEYTGGAMETKSQDPEDDPNWARLLPTFNLIRLPQHRHQLTGPCLVCKVLCRNDFKEDL